MNFYKRHLGDYAKDTGHLSMMEHGAYTMLLDRYYASEQPIPKADVYRVTRANSKPEKAATDRVLREFFTLDGDAYRSKRADAEIERASVQRAINQETGKKGGRPPKVNRTETESVSPQNRTGTEQEPYPDSRLQTPLSSSLPTEAHTERASAICEAWELICETYPAGTYRAVAWQNAERNFRRLVEEGQDPRDLAQAVDAYLRQQEAKKAIGSQFVLSPENFFSNDQWRGPFPLPATKADTRLNANISAAEEFMRRTEVV